MVSFVKHVRCTGAALAIALGLMIFSAVATPLVSDDLANLIGPTAAMAEETQGSGG